MKTNNQSEKENRNSEDTESSVKPLGADMSSSRRPTSSKPVEPEWKKRHREALKQQAAEERLLSGQHQRQKSNDNLRNGSRPKGSELDLESDKRFEYWQSFWTKVQDLRSKYREVQNDTDGSKAGSGNDRSGSGPAYSKERPSLQKQKQKPDTSSSGASKRRPVPTRHFSQPQGLGQEASENEGPRSFTNNAVPVTARDRVDSANANKFSRATAANERGTPPRTKRQQSYRQPRMPSDLRGNKGHARRTSQPSVDGSPNAHQPSKASSRAPSARADAKAEELKKKSAGGTSSTTTDSDSQGDKPSSNVERFFREEAERRKQRAERKRRAQRKIDEKAEARRVWEQLHKDVSEKWEKFASRNPEVESDAQTQNQNPQYQRTPPKRKGEDPEADAKFQEFKRAFAFKRAHSTNNVYAAASVAPKTPGGTAINVRPEVLRMSVKEMKRELMRQGRVVSLSDIVEKVDLMVQVELALRRRDRDLKDKHEQMAREAAQEKIEADVEKWAGKRGIKTLLNDIMGWRISDPEYLSRRSKFAQVSKAYKRAMLKIHPDKHMGDMKGHIRATEMFKEINTKFNAYKAQMGQ